MKKELYLIVGLIIGVLKPINAWAASYYAIPDWFILSDFVNDLIAISVPLVGITLLVSGGFLIIRALKRVS